MSRIIRSRTAKPGSVSPIALDERQTPPAYPDRPRGGLSWIDGEKRDDRSHLSQFERRRAEAETIVQTARAKALQIEKDAYLEGFEKGDQAGLALAAQKAEPVIKSLTALIASISEQRQALIENHEAELIRLAFAMAAKIIHHHLDTDDEAVAKIARGALSKVSKVSEVTIRVSPYDMEILQQQLTENQSVADLLPRSVRVEADMDIGRGGCKVLTDSGEVDATIESQLHQLQMLLWPT